MSVSLIPSKYHGNTLLEEMGLQELVELEFFKIYKQTKFQGC